MFFFNKNSFLTPQFFFKIFLDPNFFDPKLFFREKIVLGPEIFFQTQTFFGHKIFFKTKILFKDTKFFRTKFFFQIKNFFRNKIFFQTQNELQLERSSVGEKGLILTIKTKSCLLFIWYSN